MAETMATATAQRAGAGEDPLLFADQVADLIGELEGREIETRSIIFYASQSRRRERAGELTDYDMPLPREEDYTRRTVPTKVAGVTRTVRAPRWRRSAVVRWRELMRQRPAPERVRNEAGQYVPKAS